MSEIDREQLLLQMLCLADTITERQLEQTRLQAQIVDALTVLARSLQQHDGAAREQLQGYGVALTRRAIESELERRDLEADLARVKKIQSWQ